VRLKLRRISTQIIFRQVSIYSLNVNSSPRGCCGSDIMSFYTLMTRCPMRFSVEPWDSTTCTRR